VERLVSERCGKCVRGLSNKKKKREEWSLEEKKIGEKTARNQILFYSYRK